MPESVYKLVFNDPQTYKLAKNDSDLTVYTRHSVDLTGKCTFYMLSKDMKQPVEVDFYIAKEEGSVLLSWETGVQLQLLVVKPRLEYLPPQSNAHIQCSGLSQKGDTCTVYISTTTKFSIHTTHFQISNTPRRHTEESQNREDKGANSGIVPQKSSRA